MQQRPGEGGSLRDATLGRALAPYYSSGSFLQDKHTATPSAAQDFPSWVLDRLSLENVRTALDAGCGWGRFSVPLLRRLPPDSCRLVCTDLYHGMVTRAREVLLSEGFTASYVVSDIAGLPFDGGRFDLVMANHVLYHVADVPQAVRELARVLTRGGRLVATTNSDAVRVPLLETHRTVLDELGVAGPPEEPSSFHLENAPDILTDVFTNVDVHVYRNTIHYDSVESLLTVYLNTGRYRMIMADPEIPQDVRDRVAPTFATRVQEMLTEQGRIASPQLMCAVICHD